MSLHSLCLSLGIVRGRGRVGEASGASVLRQARLGALLPRHGPLSSWVHLIGGPLLYGGGEAHAVGGVLGGVAVVVVGQLGVAVQQATVPGVFPRRRQGRVGCRLLALRHPGQGVELSVGGVGHPGRRPRVVAARPGARYCAGGDGAAGGGGRSAGGAGTGRPTAGVGQAELPLVVDGPGLGTSLLVGGGSHVVVAISWILPSDYRVRLLN